MVLGPVDIQVAAGTPDSLILGPPSVPAAFRWVWTTVSSTNRYPRSKSSDNASETLPETSGERLAAEPPEDGLDDEVVVRRDDPGVPSSFLRAGSRTAPT